MKFNEQTGEQVPDYKQSLIPSQDSEIKQSLILRRLGIRTRLEFHRILGKLLGF